jgi:hypothetical protein
MALQLLLESFIDIKTDEAVNGYVALKRMD